MSLISPVPGRLFAYNIAESAYVEDTVSINHNVTIYGTARVYGNAKLSSNSIFKTLVVKDNAHVFGNAIIDASHFPENTKSSSARELKSAGISTSHNT